MARMRRSTIVALIAVGGALALIAVTTAAERLRAPSSEPGTTVSAPPQTAMLDWHERYGGDGEHIVFGVDRFEVVRNGWRAQVSVTNNTPVAYEIGNPRATLDRAFGLMLFPSKSEAELVEQSKSGTLPAIRPATRYTPALPDVLQPDDSWHGTISANGPLVAGSWVRIVFGTLVAVSNTPDVLAERVVWITDHAYQLRR
jgi:hypothetical protein